MGSKCEKSQTTKKDKSSHAPFEILNRYKSQVKRFRQGKIIGPMMSENAFSCQQLSAESIVQLAKMKLLEHTSQNTNELHPVIYPSLPYSNLSRQNLKDVQLTFDLLNAADKFSDKQFDCAEKLLTKCILLSSSADNNNPVERVVKHFAEALRERVEIERGKIDLERTTFNIEENVLSHQLIILECEQKLPSSQVTQFTAIQAILDSIGKSEKIHVIDIGIKSGQHWPIMMQGLANRKNCKLKLLKITAVGTSKDRLEETGKRLSSFAKSMNLPFLFKTVVSEIKDLRKETFLSQDDDEFVALYSGIKLWSLLAWPNDLRTFLNFVKKLNPCVMVVNEVEANTDTSIFIDRFYGALVFSLATFDYLETCLTRDSKHREVVEGLFFGEMIRNIITAEDEERGHRNAKIGFWRDLFAEFDIVETELSDSSLYQARLLIKRNPNWHSCTLHMDGKCMIVGWKGTPLQDSLWDEGKYLEVGGAFEPLESGRSLGVLGIP
ncbi:hypothetical protein DH2020_020097 [Rehmannia glutinosa]|uniref:DELLA protein n=1 Tax=Rehmannia glutinosa TaxID=99300 RepID=A0ABR0WF46_REHGL